MMSRYFLRFSLAFSALLVVLFVAACGPSAAPAPTAAPAKPAAAPTTAPAAPAPTTAPMAAPTKAPAAAPTAAPKASTPEWPTKAVSLVTHTNPGSGGDIFIRATGKAAEQVWKQPIAYENRAGGSGAVAFLYTFQQKPDGYTLLGETPTLITAPMTNKMPVDVSNFTPVARMAIDPMVIYVQYDSPYNNMKDLVDDAKANPGKIRVGGGSIGSTDHFMVAQVISSAGINMEYVPFDSGAEVVTAVAGGHIAAGAGEYGEVLPQIDAEEVEGAGHRHEQPVGGCRGEADESPGS